MSFLFSRCDTASSIVKAGSNSATATGSAGSSSTTDLNNKIYGFMSKCNHADISTPLVQQKRITKPDYVSNAVRFATGIVFMIRDYKV